MSADDAKKISDIGADLASGSQPSMAFMAQIQVMKKAGVITEDQSRYLVRSYKVYLTQAIALQRDNPYIRQRFPMSDPLNLWKLVDILAKRADDIAFKYHVDGVITDEFLGELGDIQGLTGDAVPRLGAPRAVNFVADEDDDE
jgi:hypothetical protein